MYGAVSIFGESFSCGSDGLSGFMGEAQDGVSHGGHGLRDSAGSDLAGIFAQDDIAAPMKRVFDAPMVAPESEELIRPCALARDACHGIGDFAADLAGFFAMALDPADLGGTGPIEMIDALAADRQAPDFDTTMALFDGFGLLDIGWPLPFMGSLRRAMKRRDQLRGEKRHQRRRPCPTSIGAGWL